MLKYDDQKGFFEFPQEFFDYSVDLQFKRNETSWNKPQLMIIIETLGNFMNTVFEVYRHYPGEIVKLFEKMVAVNAHQKDSNKRFLQEIINMGNEQSPRLIQNISQEIVRPYQLCIGNLTYMKLDRGLQKRITFSQQQMQDLQQIINDYLSTAIQTVRSSAVYQKAEQEDHLYYDLSQLNTLSGREEYLPSPAELLRLKSTSPGTRLNI